MKEKIRIFLIDDVFFNKNVLVESKDIEPITVLEAVDTLINHKNYIVLKERKQKDDIKFQSRGDEPVYTLESWVYDWSRILKSKVTDAIDWSETQ